VLSLLPGDKLPKIEFNLFKIDTLVHFIFYATLSFLMGIAFIFNKNEPFKKWIVLIIATGILVGCFVEVIQGNFIQNRFFSFSDIIANTIGTVIGIIVFVKIRLNNVKLW
jgi:VanZ family protein